MQVPGRLGMPNLPSVYIQQLKQMKVTRNNMSNESRPFDNDLAREYAPASGLARVVATASPGINVLSSISIPNKSKSKLAPNTRFVFKDAISSRTAENRGKN